MASSTTSAWSPRVASSSFDRQVGSHGLVAAGAELAFDEMPVPANVAGAVDQCVDGHPSDAQQGSGLFTIDL